MAIFYVQSNFKQYHDEHSGGYLLVSLHNSNGTTKAAANVMRTVRQGDVFIHAVKQNNVRAIRAVSVAELEIYEGYQEKSFPNNNKQVLPKCIRHTSKNNTEAELNGDAPCYFVKVKYFDLQKQLLLADYKEWLSKNYRKGSAFNSNGDGLQGYLHLLNDIHANFLLSEALKELSNQEPSLQTAMEEVDALSLDNLTLRRKAEKASMKNYKACEVTTTILHRDRYIATYVKNSADGKCQLCGKLAPFKDNNGRPYLECHHIEWLSRGGKDTIDNVVALCPNCHRKMHVLNNEEDNKILLLQKRKK